MPTHPDVTATASAEKRSDLAFGCHSTAIAAEESFAVNLHHLHGPPAAMLEVPGDDERSFASGVTALRRIRRTQPSAEEFIDALETEGSAAFSMILRRKAVQLVRSSGRSDYSLVQRRSWGSPYEYTHHPTDQDQVGRLPCPD